MKNKVMHRMVARVPKTGPAYKRLLYGGFGWHVAKARAFDVFAAGVTVTAIAGGLTVGHTK